MNGDQQSRVIGRLMVALGDERNGPLGLRMWEAEGERERKEENRGEIR